MQPTILIVVNDPMISNALEVLVNSMGFENTKMLDHLEQLQDCFDASIPTCILVDSVNGASEDVGFFGRFVAEHPTARGVLMIETVDVSLVVNAMRRGFSSVLEHPFLHSHFSEAVKTAVSESRELVVAERRKMPTEVCDKLTTQEEEILTQIIDGAATKEIAARLDLSIRTIHYRKNSIFEKIGAVDREHAMQIITRKNHPGRSVGVGSI